MKARGFTLLEMLVVLALMGLLASAARPMLELQAQRSRELALRESLRQIRLAIDAYRSAALAGHVAVARSDSGFPPDLESLVRGVPDLKSTEDRRLYFLRRLPRDPFADPALPPARTWVLRSSDSAPEQPRAGRDVFDVSSGSTRLALDGTRLADW